MPLLSENDYIKAADEVVESHFATGEDLTSCAAKVADYHGLNPEQTKTLAKLANVAGFQKYFKKRANDEDLVEFEVADPDAVVSQLINKVAAEAVVVPDNYDRAADFGASFEPAAATEKVAGERPPLPSPTVRVADWALKLAKLEEELAVREITLNNQWQDAVKNAALWLRKQSVNDTDRLLGELEKSAYACWGVEAAPEIAGIRHELRKTELRSPHEKHAERLQKHFLAEDNTGLQLLKTARKCRHDYETATKGRTWVSGQRTEAQNRLKG